MLQGVNMKAAWEKPAFDAYTHYMNTKTGCLIKCFGHNEYTDAYICITTVFIPNEHYNLQNNEWEVIDCIEQPMKVYKNEIS